MKAKILSSLTLIVIAATILIYSCKKKKDDTAPVTAAATDYAGSWKTTDQCPTSTTYTLTVTASGSSLTLKGLFHGCFTSVSATSSENSFTIPSQTFTNATQSQCGYPYTVSGSGTISGTPFNTLQFSFTVKDGSGNTTSCTSSATKL